MLTGARRVRRLSLRAPHEALLRRGAILVEDALRTASLPDADGGRLYLVRRLSLGTIDASRAPAALAQLIERRLSALRMQAVHAESPAAVAAPVVYFDDALEPFIALARRLSVGSANEWFWPLAVPGYRASLSRALGVSLVLGGASETSGGARALLQVLSELSVAELDVVCEALEPADGEVLLTRLGWAELAERSASLPPMAADDRHHPALRAHSPLIAPWPELLARWVGHWGVHDPRATLLAAIALSIADAPLAREPQRVPRYATEVAAHVERAAAGAAPSESASEQRADASAERSPLAREHAPERLPLTAAEIAQANAVVHDITPAGAPPTAADATEALVAGLGGRMRERMRRPAAVAADAPAVAPARAPRRRPIDAPRLTEAGGLLFLIRPLVQLGFPAYLDRLDAPAVFAARLLRYVAQRARVPAEDAIHEICAAPAARLTSYVASTRASAEDATHDGSAPPEQWLMPFAASLRASADDAIHDGSATPELEAALSAWRATLCGWSRRNMRVPLTTIVRRPAHVLATRTHIDVWLALNDADPRVRAFGLDIDPGWVAWLGRVVQFHYVEEI